MWICLNEVFFKQKNWEKGGVEPHQKDLVKAFLRADKLKDIRLNSFLPNLFSFHLFVVADTQSQLLLLGT